MEAYNPIKILNAKINLFKNLKDKTFFFEKNAIVFKGKNGLGKSNILNAMYWCLTGVDLNNCSDNSQFVPKSLRAAESGILVDVELKLNTFKLRRTIEIQKGTLVESIYINDIKSSSLKEGEIDIDNKLGILPLTLSTYTNKDFVMRRFLMNPTYIYTLTPKAIRDVVIKKYIHKAPASIGEEILNKDITRKVIAKYYKDEIKNVRTTIMSCCAMLESEIKRVKSQMDQAEAAVMIVSTLQDVETQAVTNKLKDLISFERESMFKLETDKRILDAALLEYDNAIEEIAEKETQLVNFKLSTINQKGVKKSALEIVSNEIDVAQRSTSESIVDAINMQNEYLEAVGNNACLPLFIDKAESISIARFYNLSTGSNQVFATRVTDSDSDIISVEEF